MFRSTLIIISIGLLGGCAFLDPVPYDPAAFDSRDYYAMENNVADDFVLGVPGLAMGFGSSWPVFGALSPFTTNSISPGSASGFSGSSFSSLDQNPQRYFFCPGFSNNPISPVLVSRGPRPNHFAENGRINRNRGSVRTSRSTPAARQHHRSLSQSYAMARRSGGLIGGQRSRASRGRRRAVR